jgi:signal transduction histidine kinase
MQPSATDYLAEITSRVAHEFNNILNSILLQLALFEQRGLAPREYPELATIRRMGTGTAALIKQLQQLIHKQQGPLHALDLNTTVQQALHAWQQENPTASPVHCEWAPDLPPVLGTISDLTRLVHLLLSSSAVALVGASGTITLQTGRTPHYIQLSVEDTGPSLAPEQMLHLFEPFAVTRTGGAGWEMMVCKALAGHLQGNCHGENRAEGGMVFVIDLQPAFE